MKTRTTYSTQYHVYYEFGGSLSAGLKADSLVELKALMRELANHAGQHGDQAITFEPIVKTVETKIETKGHFVQFVKKLQNGVYYGDHKIDQEFYKPLKHRGSGRQGNSLQKSFK